MSNTTRKFGVTDERFVPKIPSPRRPLPRMMPAKPVKVRTVSTGDSKPSDAELEADNSEDDHHSDPQDEDETDDAQNNLGSNQELHSPKFPNKLDYETQNIKKPKVVETQTPHQSSCKKQSDSKRKYYFSIPIVVLILAIVVPYCYGYLPIGNSTKSKEDPQSEKVLIKNLENNIDSISNKFKHQNSEIWDDILAGVSEVVRNPDELSIILLVSEDDYLMSCLAKMIGNATKAALGSSEELMLSPSQLGDIQGNVIHKFQNQIKKQKIVIVDNLLDVNPRALLDFHHLCDTETPLVTHVVYILTMVAKEYDKKNKEALKFIEKKLELKLKGQIDPDKINPLITRLTDGVIIPVQPEPDFKSCPLRY